MYAAEFKGHVVATPNRRSKEKIEEADAAYKAGKPEEMERLMREALWLQQGGELPPPPEFTWKLALA